MAAPRPYDSGAGERIGNFAILERLGRGAMGEVYLAHDEGLGRDVAIKILAEAHRQNPELRTRFLREARAMARISHPNVVHIYTIAEHNDLPYFVMEVLDGTDLATLLKEEGAIRPSEAAKTILLAAKGLQAAAKIGVVHRDVKPSNIIVTRDGAVKLTDFGLAKAIGVDPELTAAGVVVGTPDYIAPEQARGEPTDSRADLYSLGCSLYHLVAGTPPFRAADGPNGYMAIINRHMNAPRPKLGDQGMEVDADLVALCEQMMAVRADKRPDVDDVIRRLEGICARLNARLPRIRAREGEAQSSSTLAAGPRGRRAVGAQGTWISAGVAGIPGWAIIVTILCIAVFLVGLGLRLAA